jgi:hypothetical protein
MKVNEKYRNLITTESVAVLAPCRCSASRRSTLPPPATHAGSEWGYVKSGPSVGSLSEAATKATEGIEQLTAVLTDVRGGRGTIGQLMTNDSLYRELNNLVATAERNGPERRLRSRHNRPAGQ